LVKKRVFFDLVKEKLYISNKPSVRTRVKNGIHPGIDALNCIATSKAIVISPATSIPIPLITLSVERRSNLFLSFSRRSSLLFIAE